MLNITTLATQDAREIFDGAEIDAAEYAAVMQELNESTPLADATFTIGAETHRLADHLRKTHAVVLDGKVLASRHNNSTDARAEADATGGKVIVTCVSSTPKKSFWAFYKKAAGKRALAAAGIHVQKIAGEYVVAPEKASRHFWKTYRSFDSMRGQELDCYDAALKDAIRDGDGPGSDSERENLRELRENFGLAPSSKYAAR